MAAVPVASRVLDLGCGAGRHTDPLVRLGFDLWACDEDAEAVAAARARLDRLLGEDEALRRVTPARPAALGYPDEHFDWVVAHGVYDRAASAAAMKEMLAETRRVLKDGGWVIAAFRRAAGLALTPETLTKLLAEAGFALAEEPVEEETVVRGIYRKANALTPV